MHNKKIYALCDYQTLQKFDISLLEYLDLLKSYNIVYIQYRDKINDIETQKQNLQLIKSNTNIPIIINDKLELLNFADGLHIGQEDLENLSFSLKLSKIDTIRFLRKKYPSKILGLSTHDEKEILEANSFDIDYIGLGAYRTTVTKDVPNCLGDKVSYLAKISKYPVGVIGGVKVDDEIKNIDYLVIGSGLLL